MPDKIDQHPAPEARDALTPDETLTLAQIEQRLMAVQTKTQFDGSTMERPPFAEGVSRISPLAHLSRRSF